MTNVTPSVTAAIYYHGDCLDGFGAAFAAWKHWGDRAIYRGMHYGNTWEAEEVAGRDVFILDFSFPPEELFRMAEHAQSVTQLDHHITAQEKWKEQLLPSAEVGVEHFEDEQQRLKVIFCQAKSGARLAWEFFHRNTPCPLLLQHIEDQDLWRFSLLDTKSFCAGLRLRNFEFEVYDRIVHSDPEHPEFGYNIVRNEGNAISRFLQQQVSRLSNSPNVVPLELPVPATGGTRTVRGLAINCDALFASELGEQLALKCGTFGLIWQLTCDNFVKVSLRAAGNVDVAHLAEQYGGGGHRNAAGFRLSAGEFFSKLFPVITPGES